MAFKKYNVVRSWDALPQILGVTDVCNLFSVTDQTVLKWAKEKTIPSALIGGKRFFDKEQLREMLTRRTS